MILDWVPAHFPRDEWALARFDGTRALRARRPAPGRASRLGHARLQLRPQRGAQLPARERALLARASTTSTACASTRSPRCSTSTTRARPGEWVPNEYGGRENLEAIAFLQRAERGRPRARSPGVDHGGRGVDRVARRLAADRTSAGSASASSGTWAGCTTRSTTSQHDPVHRRYHHDQLTFGLIYAFTENFVLPLSHDEVVHGKGSLLGKMPGDRWQQFANLRALLRLHVGAPGQEAAVHGRRDRPGARVERTTRSARLAPARATPTHAGVQALVRDLNRVYRDEPALWERRLRAGRLPLARGERRATTNVLAFARFAGDGERAARLRLQLHAGAAPRLPRRAAARRPLARGAEHRRAPSTAAAASATCGAVDGRGAAVARASRARPR